MPAAPGKSQFRDPMPPPEDAIWQRIGNALDRMHIEQGGVWPQEMWEKAFAQYFDMLMEHMRPRTRHNDFFTYYYIQKCLPFVQQLRAVPPEGQAQRKAIMGAYIYYYLRGVQDSGLFDPKTKMPTVTHMPPQIAVDFPTPALLNTDKMRLARMQYPRPGSNIHHYIGSNHAHYFYHRGKVASGSNVTDQTLP